MKAKTKKYFVYVITNTDNGKQYIGKTSGENIFKRFKDHKQDANKGSEKCPKLYNSMRKHGTDKFIIEQLEVWDDEEYAYDREEILVEEWDTRVNGLNTVRGGRGGMTDMGHLIAGEKNGMYGRTGELNPFYGKEHTPEFIKAIKEQNRVLTNEVVIDIKKMLTEKKKYHEIRKKYEGQYELSDVSISRIKDGQRYADVGTEYKLSRPKHMSEADAIAILALWEEYPNKFKKNGRINLEDFYEKNVQDVFNVSKQKTGSLVKGTTWTHLERKTKNLECDKGLPDEIVLDIKKMLSEKTKYKEIIEKYKDIVKLNDPLLSKIKAGNKYADVGKDQFQLSRKKQTNKQDAIDIIALWEAYPPQFSSGGSIKISKFYDEKIKNVFNLTQSRIGSILKGAIFKNLKRNYEIPKVKSKKDQKS